MIAPLPCFSITGSTYLQPRNAVLRLWLICLSQTSSLIATASPGAEPPTLLTRMSMRPNRFTQSSTAALTSLGLGHVDAARDAGAAFLLDDGLGDVGCLLAQIDAIDLGALARQQHGRGLAVAPHLGVGIVADRAGTGYEGDFVLEAEHVRFPMSGTAGT